MIIECTKNAWEDYKYWDETSPENADKIKDLIRSINHPFQELGNPEPLKYGLKGFWSRRITQEHSMVFRVTGRKEVDQKCIIIQWRFHYN